MEHGDIIGMWVLLCVCLNSSGLVGSKWAKHYLACLVTTFITRQSSEDVMLLGVFRIPRL